MIMRNNTSAVRARLLSGVAAAALALGAAPAKADNFNTGLNESPAPIIPLGDRGVGSIIYLDSVIDEDHGTPKIGFGFPLFQDGDELVTFWGEAYYGIAIDAPEDYVGGMFGPSYRLRLDGDTAIGANLFIDLGAADGGDEFVGQAGLGLEFEQILDPSTMTTLRLGVNGYLPFQDYSDVSEFGVLDTAPQLGADAFLRVGRDVTEATRLDLTFGVFGYAEGDDSDGLFGANATVGATYAGRLLPDGVALNGYVGPRWATGGDGAGNSDDRFDVFGGLGLSVAFGGETVVERRIVTQSEFVPGRDCVVERVGDERFYDCRRPVIHGDGGHAKDGEFVVERIPAPAPEVTVVEDVIPGTAPVRPERHIGYRTMFAPISR